MNQKDDPCLTDWYYGYLTDYIAGSLVYKLVQFNSIPT